MAPSPTTCRYCQFYSADRRWAGECQLLQVTVGSDWPACRSSSQLFSEPAAAVPVLSSPAALPLTEAEWGLEATTAPLQVGVA